jgi:phosphoribosyl-AMP cyclohydrolase / phosphoribosyl-ATP pyrophosphohydrolase
MDTKNINFGKSNGLIPCIIQDNTTLQVLMLGYMNQEAVDKTIETNKVTFFSRSKNRIWVKGEESGNFLEMSSISVDCDNDTILIKAEPIGPTCHTGSKTCWNEEEATGFGVVSRLEAVIADRINNPSEKSYVSDLMSRGINKVAQKVGEEGVEVVIEALGTDDNLFLNESADLLFHYLILLQAKGFKMNDVLTVLKGREKKE